MNEKHVIKGYILALLALLMAVMEFFGMPFYPIMYDPKLADTLAIIILAVGWGCAVASLVYFLKIEEDQLKRSRKRE